MTPLLVLDLHHTVGVWLGSGNETTSLSLGYKSTWLGSGNKTKWLG